MYPEYFPGSSWTHSLTPLPPLSKYPGIPPCTLGTSQNHSWTHSPTPPPLFKYPGNSHVPWVHPRIILDTHLPPPPLSKYPGIPMYPGYFPGSFLDTHCTPPLVQVSRDPMYGTLQDHSWTHSPTPAPCPSIPGFPCTLGTSQDHSWTHSPVHPPLSKYPGYFPASSLDIFTINIIVYVKAVIYSSFCCVCHRGIKCRKGNDVCSCGM